MRAWHAFARLTCALGFPLFLALGARGQCLDWSDGFGVPGVDESVFASIVHDDGTGGGPALIVGGQFTSAGDVFASGVARWNGSDWEPLGSGLGGAGGGASAHAFAIHDEGNGPVLFAGGQFVTAGGQPAANIARWDGVGWSTLGAGVDSSIRAMAVYDDGLGAGPCLYVGGFFSQAGGQPAKCLARWDGVGWTEVGGGIPGTNVSVQDLVVYDDGSGPALFVAGGFSQVGSTAATNIARWDGTAWSALGAGTGYALALAVYDDGSGADLYVGGEFTSAGGVNASRIARWDGQAWSTLGAGLNDAVRSLGVHDDGSGPALIAGGQFTEAGGAAAARIARWNGSSWSPLGAGIPAFSSIVWTLCSVAPGPGGGGLVAGGGFASAGSVGAANVAWWNGGSWFELGHGQGMHGGAGSMGPGAWSFALFDDGLGSGPALYAAGGFGAAGTAPTPDLGLVHWDGSAWHAVPANPSVYGPARALAVFDPGSGPGLYCGWGGGVAMWDGRTWVASQQIHLHGSWGGAYALATHDDGSGPALYVGGQFTDGCMSGLANILRWDGTSCSAVGGGLGIVSALLEFDDGTGPALYAAGSTAYFPPSSGYVARWDGSQWTYLGSGMDSGVGALVAFDDGSGLALYAGGNFQSADGTPAKGIARWTGTTWVPVGAGITSPGFGQVNALAVHDDGSGGGPALYAAGRFEGMGQVPTRSIARWDGVSWSALGLGIETGYYEDVLALRSFDDGSGKRLFAGGSFKTAGGKPSVGIARWGENCGCTGTTYCTAKTNSSACLPAIGFSGITNLTATQPFMVFATNVVNNKYGLLFYGKNGADNQPALGGTLCVRSPFRRTPVQWSGGNPPPNDCSGLFSMDFKGYALSGADPGLVAGVTVHAQYWYRDPPDPVGSGLTDAVAFTLCP